MKVVEILEVKGDYQLVKYQSGLYAAEINAQGIGKTFKIETYYNVKSYFDRHCAFSMAERDES